MNSKHKSKPIYNRVWLKQNPSFVADTVLMITCIFTVNQQMLVAIKVGVSQNEVIWRLPVYAVYYQRYLRMLAATNIRENTQFAKFAKYNSTPNFVDLQ